MPIRSDACPPLCVVQTWPPPEGHVYHYVPMAGSDLPLPPKGEYVCGHVFKGKHVLGGDKGHGWTQRWDQVNCPGCLQWGIEHMEVGDGPHEGPG